MPPTRSAPKLITIPAQTSSALRGLSWLPLTFAILDGDLSDITEELRNLADCRPLVKEVQQMRRDARRVCLAAIARLEKEVGKEKAGVA